MIETPALPSDPSPVPAIPQRSEEEILRDWSDSMVQLMDSDLPTATEAMKVLCYELMGAAQGRATPKVRTLPQHGCCELQLEGKQALVDPD
jgi:hypothetical protein